MKLLRSLKVWGTWFPGAWSVQVFAVLSVLALGVGLASAQEVTLADYQKLRINEILANNDTTEPQNCRCRFRDMVEIYNGSDKTLPLENISNGSSIPNGVVRLWDRSFNIVCIGTDCTPQTLRNTYRLKREIAPGERLVIFCDGPIDCTSRTDLCSTSRAGIAEDLIQHAPFGLAGQGECLLLTLDPDSTFNTDDEVLLHEVTFPRLPADVSYARLPEDVNNTDTFVLTTTPTFGTCAGLTAPVCVGASNTGPNPIPPNIEIMDYTTNSPAAGEAVTFRVRIDDEASPMEVNFNFVELRYYVDTDPSDEDLGVEQTVDMNFLAFVDEPDPPDEPEPVGERCGSLREWSIWEASIPGQAAGAVVRFAVFCQDADGLDDADPNLVHCPLGVGPCDLDAMGDPVNGPGPGCDGDGVPDDCNALFRYTVGSTYAGTVSINEVVPDNDTLEDAVDETDMCDTIMNPNCKNDDFLELCNSSSTMNESLVGYVLSSRPFRPERGWVFETFSEILPLEHRMVWIDNDGVEPDPLANPPEPDNPNNPAAGEHHTDFQVAATRDEIFLLDTAANNFQVIDSVRWGVSGRYAHSGLEPLARPANSGILTSVLRDESVARSPDCDAAAGWQLATTEFVTPGEENMLPVVGGFKRGDVDSSGTVSINDPISNLVFQFLGGFDPDCMDALDTDDSGGVTINDPIVNLTFQFLGGVIISPPGTMSCGPDLTDDSLGCLAYPQEKC